MKDTNHTYLSASFLHIRSVPHAVAFQVAMSMISALVIVTSALVLKHIFGKERKSRADFLFVTASVSDIGVGLLTLPLEGLYVACITLINCSVPVFYLTYASKYLLSLSYMITTVMAVDRLLFIGNLCNYKKLVTNGRMKIILVLCSLFSIGYYFVFIYYVIHLQRYLFSFLIVNLISLVIFPLAVAVAYMRLLCYVFRHSTTMLHSKIMGKSINKKLTKTIMLTLCFQVIFLLPLISLQLLFTLDIFGNSVNLNLHMYYIIPNWFYLLASCQFFANKIIYLVNQRRNVRKTKPAD